VESSIATFMTRLAGVVDLITGLIIGFAVLEATVRTARLYFAALTNMAADKEAVRLRLGKWLALALEFALASDIVRTAVGPSWDEIGKLAAIMGLRTTLNYFLEREFEQAARMWREPIREAA
jgi:uncharacterized membrane protein